MKKVAVIMALAAFAVQANAQFSVSLKVDIDNDSRSNLINNGGKYDNSELRIYDSSFEFAPSFGYELDEWEVGVEVGIYHSTYKSRNYMTGDLDNDKTFSFSPSVYGRRNFGLTDKLNLFAECKLGMSFDKDTDPVNDYDKSFGVFLSAYPGLSYQLTDNFVLEAFFNYPQLYFYTGRTSYYDSNDNLVGDGSSRTYFVLRPIDNFRDLMYGISLGITYCF